MPATGEAVLRVDRVGMTANNVTYALLGDAMHYWDFFPTRPGRGLVPLWGFGEVVRRRPKECEVGSRVYGYFPSASHLVVRPGSVDARGFRDAREHRAVAAVALQQLRAHHDRRRVRAPTRKTC